MKAEGERTGSPRNAEGRNSDSSRTDGDRPRRNNNDRPGTGNRRPDGQNRQGRPQGEGRSQGGRFGQGRNQGEGNRQGRRSWARKIRRAMDNRQGGRFGQGRSQGDGQGRPGGRFQGDGNRQGGRFGQGRPQGDGNRQGGRPQGNGQGRPDGNRSEGRDGRFGGSQGRQGQRQNTRKNDDMAFAPELTKTSKDSKRERDRENKNKKKDFDKTQSGGRRPNQGGFNKNSRIPKALQKPAPQPKQEEKKPEVKEITLPEKMTIRELAEAMKMQPSVIVKKLFMQGMMVTVNHEIDFEKAQEIALEYDIIAEPEEKVDVIEELLKEDEEDEKDMVSRPPVVCVMGHVDHGKTSLLDAIRKTNVTRGEAGGITQHIGASVVEVGGQKITFLDTPGHEAFTAMRMRGANSTDIAVLVVAADDGVMPQTVEAISHAKAAGVEIIVAINKIDKPSANIERVKQELSEYELIPEDWGGSTIFVPVSAHTGEGIDTLLEMILLTAEVCELKANPNRSARGLVIEAQLDKGKGPVATILVQKGTLHVGDFIAAGACNGKVRAMMDDKGRRIKEAGPSTPVEILGLGDVPNAGEILLAFDSDKEAKNFAGAFVSENKNRLLEETKGKLSLDNLFDQIQASDLKELPLIVKADVQGSVEAVKQSLTKLSNEEVVVKVIHGGVGAINESDVSLAATSNAIIIGFNVRPDATAKQLAEQEGVDLRLYRVIYQAIEDVEAAMKGMLDPIFEEKVIGHAEVRQLFKASGIGTIAGSYILDGIFQRNCKVRISREGEQIFEGELASLKRFKDDVKEVKAGYECGLVFDGFNDVKEEDKVEAYIMVEVPR
ncbi:MAG: translation initiation factor IF-2 [Blautia wexlerae]